MKTSSWFLNPGHPGLYRRMPLLPLSGGIHLSLNSTGVRCPASERLSTVSAKFQRKAGTEPPELRAHCGKEQHFSERLGAGQHHHQAVDAEADATGRRHSLFERFDERLVER